MKELLKEVLAHLMHSIDGHINFIIVLRTWEPNIEVQSNKSATLINILKYLGIIFKLQ